MAFRIVSYIAEWCLSKHTMNAYHALCSCKMPCPCIESYKEFHLHPPPSNNSPVLCLPLPEFLILKLPPILLYGLVAARRLDRVLERGGTRIQLVARLHCSLGLFTHGNRLVSTEALAHVDHSTLTFPQALFQLLALGRHLIDERGAEAVGGLIALDHDAVGFLEALC